MRRFLLFMALTFLLGMGGAWYWVVHDKIKFADADYGVRLAKKLMLDDCDVGTLAVIGDSQAETSIVPKLVGPGVVNFGLTGASYITMLEISRRIVACPAPPKAVLITVNPNSFMSLNRFWKTDAKYNLFGLNFEEIRRRARAWEDATLYDKPAPFDIEARLKDGLLQMQFPAYSFATLLHGYFFLREEVNQGYLRDTLKDRGYHYIGDTVGDARIEDIARLKHFLLSGFIETYFAEILDLYASHNIPVYFFSAPAKSTALGVMSPEFRDEYAAYIRQWERRYSNFHVLGEVMSALPPEYYGDAVHLTAVGAAVWSRHLADMLAVANIDAGKFAAPR